MRLLFTTLPEYGHFHTLVRLAHAAVAAGHEVSFSTAAEFCERVERAGFPCFPAGLGFRAQVEEATRRYPHHAGLPTGEAKFEVWVPHMLAGVAAPARAEDLRGVIDVCRPDVVVHGEAELGGPLAAAAAGIPYAAQGVTALRPLHMLRLQAELLAPASRRWGVELGPYGGMFQYLYLDPCPPRLQSSEIAQVRVAHPCDAEGKPVGGLGEQPAAGNAVAFDGAGGEELPSWVHELADRPTVYVTFGTINRDLSLFEVVLEALAEEPVNVVATVGRENDPAALGALGPHIHVERYVPQSLLLPHCDLVVNHAGSIYPVLGLGIPLLVIPQKANEFQNAAACLRAGAARALTNAELNPEAVRTEVRTLLRDPTYRQAARRVAADIAAMPGPAEGVRLLERLAEERRPLVRRLSGRR